MPENWIMENWVALAIAFAAGLILALLFGGGRRGSGAAAPTTPVSAPAPAPARAPAAPAGGNADLQRAVSADMASLRRRLAMAEAALRELRRGG